MHQGLHPSTKQRNFWFDRLPLTLLLQHGAQICHVQGTGETQVHFMDWGEDEFPEIKALLEHGFDLDVQDNEGSTLLHKFIRFSCLLGSRPIRHAVERLARGLIFGITWAKRSRVGMQKIGTTVLAGGTQKIRGK